MAVITTETPAETKARIISLFMTKVKGEIPNTSGSNVGHDGKGGHWLETQMGVSHNASNTPDINGFEMKNDTTSKTTFGDWSADYYIFNDTEYFSKDKAIVNRDKFMHIFGASNPLKKDRYSWSGKCFPKIGDYNDFGQKLVVNDKDNIFALYSFTADKRANKNTVVPVSLQKDDLILAKWEVSSITKKVEDKFNQLGWFKCIKDKKTGAYTEIVFGEPINFQSWLKGVRSGLIYLDSGMHVGNIRPYSNWRAGNSYWESLVTERY